MNLMTITAKGQFTLNKQLMEHMKVKPGDKIIIEKLPDGTLQLKSEVSLSKLSDLCGFIKSDINLSDSDIQEVIAQSYLDRGLSGLDNK